jgi:hypothetical protein
MSCSFSSSFKQQQVLVEGIIKTNIDRLKTKDWDELKEQIITKFMDIDFTKLIEDYQPCDEDNLYVSESELIEIMDTYTFISYLD